MADLDPIPLNEISSSEHRVLSNILFELCNIGSVNKVDTVFTVSDDRRTFIIRKAKEAGLFDERAKRIADHFDAMSLVYQRSTPEQQRARIEKLNTVLRRN